MSEPHELEERLMEAVNPDRGDPSNLTAGGKFLSDEHARKIVRDVLALVRQEQEKMGYTINIYGINQWWLSHTAKETSNG